MIIVYSENHIKLINSGFSLQYKVVLTFSIVLGRVSGVVNIMLCDTHALILHDAAA